MNREEKIEFLEFIKDLDGIPEEFIEEKMLKGAGYSEHEYDDKIECLLEFQNKLIDILLSLLQINPRTIDTLEVGDFVQFHYNGESSMTVRKLISGRVKKNEGNYLTLDFGAFKASYPKWLIDEIDVYPHELFETWGELNK